MCFGTNKEGYLYWVKQSKIHVHLESQSVAVSGHRVSADAICPDEVVPEWGAAASNPSSGILTQRPRGERRATQRDRGWGAVEDCQRSCRDPSWQ